MVRGHRQNQLRGAILAAASVLGVPVEITDGDEWSVTEGSVRVGLGQPDCHISQELRGVDLAAAQTLLLLWESAREVQFAPFRRSRRLALSRDRPELEPMLAAIDRLFAVSELLTALPAFRPHVFQAVLSALPANPAELPRHLQWIVLLLRALTGEQNGEQTGAPSDEGPFDGFEVSVCDEWAKVGEIGEGVTARDVLRLVLTPTPSRTPLRRFERAYALLVPAYERLLKLDLREKGLDSRGLTSGTTDDADGEDIAAGSRGGGDSDEFNPGGTADDGVTDERTDSARAGNREENAEGADLFAAEQAGFIAAVLETPLPANGDWPEGLTLPDIESDSHADSPSEASPRDVMGGAQVTGDTQHTGLAEYRDKTSEFAADIDDLRDLWRSVISERFDVRKRISRIPTPDGDMLDRTSFVRVVSEVTAGVDRPRAYLSLEKSVKRTRRDGSTDYVLLIDRSASMQGAAAEAAADAALIILESLAGVMRDIAAEERVLGIDLQLSLRTALIVFDSTPTVVKPLSGALDDRVRRQMHAEIRSPRGSTNDAAALEVAAKEFGIQTNRRSVHANIQRRRVLIVVSDGGTDDGGSASKQIRALRAQGVSVFGIGIRTNDLAVRFAPSGVSLSDPSQLAHELKKLVATAGLDV